VTEIKNKGIKLIKVEYIIMLTVEDLDNLVQRVEALRGKARAPRNIVFIFNEIDIVKYLT